MFRIDLDDIARCCPALGLWPWDEGQPELEVNGIVTQRIDAGTALHQQTVVGHPGALFPMLLE